MSAQILSTPLPTACESIPMGEGSLFSSSSCLPAALNDRRQSLSSEICPPSISSGSGGTSPSPSPGAGGSTPQSHRADMSALPRHRHLSINARVLTSPSSSQHLSRGVIPYLAPEKENINVTVRFRPLSVLEVKEGHEVGWYADGDNVVRMESDNTLAFAFDRVFSPTTSTRGIYEFAVRSVVRAAMEGINGTVFAFGITGSGKTFTMHGVQRSPGIIPLALEEIFGIIQETPGREFLLRASYMEIYDEAINDLMNPSGQNLRIRDDVQLGPYVENIKEEAVSSPAHALSLIAAAEEHRHVGATNNMISSRSHTIFTLKIESSGIDAEGNETVVLSQLHLVDMAGSESSKVMKTGVTQQEGSYINRSLLTLGTVIEKLSKGKDSHIPFRNSKLTRLLQSSLSGSSRISLICNVTPASGYLEETHNTLKFATVAKRVEVRAEQNKISDEKSLLRKYQRELSQYRAWLQQFRSSAASTGSSSQEEWAAQHQKLEGDPMQMEAEGHAKAEIVESIRHLTQIILASSSENGEPVDRPTNGRHLSFGEEDGSENDSMECARATEEVNAKQQGLHSWLSKGQVDEPSTSRTGVAGSNGHSIHGNVDLMGQDVAAGEVVCTAFKPAPGPRVAGVAAQLELQKEQVNVVSAELALLTNWVERLREQAPSPASVHDNEIQRAEEEIAVKRQQMKGLEQRLQAMSVLQPPDSNPDIAKALTKLKAMVNDKTLDKEVVDMGDLQQHVQVLLEEREKLLYLQQNLVGELAKARMTAVVHLNAEGVDLCSLEEKDAQLAYMAGQLQVLRVSERKMAVELAQQNAELARSRRREWATQKALEATEALRLAEARHMAATALMEETKALPRGKRQLSFPN